MKNSFHLGNDANWLTALQGSGVSALEWRFLSSHVVLTTAHKSSEDAPFIADLHAESPCCFTAFGAMPVITRTTAGKEMSCPPQKLCASVSRDPSTLP